MELQTFTAYQSDKNPVNPWLERTFKNCTVQPDPEDWEDQVGLEYPTTAPAAASTSTSTSTSRSTVTNCYWVKTGSSIYYKEGSVWMGTARKSNYDPRVLISKRGTAAAEEALLELRNCVYASGSGMAGTASSMIWSYSIPTEESNGYKVAGIKVGTAASWAINTFTSLGVVRTWGASGTGAGQFDDPYGICSDGTYIYVAEHTNHRISKWTANDIYLNGIGGTSPGSGNDQFNYPHGMCYSGGNIYVADSFNNRISIRSSTDLSYVDKFGTSGSGDDNFNEPNGICTDGTYLYIADSGNNRIIKRLLASPYTYQAKIGTFGTGDGQFKSPWGICTDGIYLYVTDVTNSRIQKLNCSDLAYVAKVGSLTSLQGICYLGGFLFFPTQPSNGWINKYTVALAYVEQATSSYAGAPIGICSYDNDVYLTRYLGSDTITIIHAIPHDPTYTIESFMSFEKEIDDGWVEMARFTEDGDFVVGKTTATEKIESSANIKADLSFISAVVTGTIPVQVSSTTMCTNLNADLLDGSHASAFEGAFGAGTTAQYLRGDKTWQTLNQAAVAGLTTASTPTFAGLNLTGNFTFTWADRSISSTYSALWYWGLYFTESTRKLELKIQSNDTGGNIYLTPSLTPAVGYVYTGLLRQPIAATAYRLPVATATNVMGELAAVGATGEYLKGNTGAIPSWATLNQAAVAGLTSADSPAFVTVKCSGLTDGYIPYHVTDAAGLANSGLYWDGAKLGIGTVPAAFFVFHIKDTTAQFCAQRDSDNNAGPVFRLMKTRTTGQSAQDNDITGYLTFDFYNDNAVPELINSAYLRGQVTDVSDGTEDGSLEFHVTVAGVDRATVILSDVNAWFYGDVSALTFTDRP